MTHLSVEIHSICATLWSLLDSCCECCEHVLCILHMVHLGIPFIGNGISGFSNILSTEIPPIDQGHTNKFLQMRRPSSSRTHVHVALIGPLTRYVKLRH